jgi:hypothetical protein
MKLLENERNLVRKKTAYLIKKLANHGEWLLESTGTADLDNEVKFREVIAGVLPSLIEGRDLDIQLLIVELVGELANHG